MLKFAKVREVKSINRGTNGSAGLDFFVPVATVQFVFDFEKLNPNVAINKDENGVTTFIIPPNGAVIIPSGIKVEIPKNKVLIGFNKSGIAVKKGLVLGACVIDSDYQGEYFINLINTRNTFVSFAENEKIVQTLLLDAWHGEPQEVELEDLYKNSDSERGDGAMGSTNK